jgi:hypothetical protein
LQHVVWWKITDASEVLAVSIIMSLIMKVESTSEILANFYWPTWCNSPKGQPPSKIIVFE